MIYHEDIIYRPPMESNSVLLELCTGCSYGKCTFCRCSSGKEDFCLYPDEEIREQLSKLSGGYRGERRLFITGGNVFAFKAEFLSYIFSLIKFYLPGIDYISMYARAEDVLNKPEEKITGLKQEGLGTLYIGVESGSDRILSLCNKGTDTDRMLKAFGILDSLGVNYGISIITGLGGEGTADEASSSTAEFINRLYPESIRVMTLTPLEGTKLFEDVETGRFKLQSQRESLTEEKLLLEKLIIKRRCLFASNHVSNLIPLVGFLPDDKDRLLRELKSGIEKYDSGDIRVRDDKDSAW